MYLFTWESPKLGAAHALDLMLFGNGIPFAALAGTTHRQTVEKTMRKMWTTFAHTGNPSIEELDWPAYGAERRLTMELNETSQLLEDPYAVERDALADVIEGNWSEMGL